MAESFDYHHLRSETVNREKKKVRVPASNPSFAGDCCHC